MTAAPPGASGSCRPWNTQTPETFIPTFWTAVTAGAYVMWGHAATYEMGDPLTGLRQSPTPRHLRIAHDLLTTLPYWEMEPQNDAVSPAESIVEGQAYRTNFCLAKGGEVYLIFSWSGGPLTVNLSSGDAYHATQVDPRTGDQTDLGRVDGGSPQTVSITGKVQVLLLRR